MIYRKESAVKNLRNRKTSAAPRIATPVVMTVVEAAMEGWSADGDPLVGQGTDRAYASKIAVPGLRLEIGDRVLVATTSDGAAYVLGNASGVHRPAAHVETTTAEGDLVLRAPNGRIVLEAGTDLELRSG